MSYVNIASTFANQAAAFTAPYLTAAKTAATPYINSVATTVAPYFNGAVNFATPYLSAAKTTATPYFNSAIKFATPYVNATYNAVSPYATAAYKAGAYYGGAAYQTVAPAAKATAAFVMTPAGAAVTTIAVVSLIALAAVITHKRAGNVEDNNLEKNGLQLAVIPGKGVTDISEPYKGLLTDRSISEKNISDEQAEHFLSLYTSSLVVAEERSDAPTVEDQIEQYKRMCLETGRPVTETMIGRIRSGQQAYTREDADRAIDRLNTDRTYTNTKTPRGKHY